MSSEDRIVSRRGKWGCALAATCVLAVGGTALAWAVNEARMAARRSADK